MDQRHSPSDDAPPWSPDGTHTTEQGKTTTNAYGSNLTRTHSDKRNSISIRQIVSEIDHGSKALHATNANKDTPERRENFAEHGEMKPERNREEVEVGGRENANLFQLESELYKPTNVRFRRE